MGKTKTLGTLLSLTLIVSVLVCLAALAVPAQSADTGVLGNTSTGSTTYPGATQEIGGSGGATSSFSYNYMRAQNVTPTTSGTIMSIGLDIYTAAGNLRMAIYAADTSNSSFPGAFLGSTAGAATVVGWNDQALTSPVNVTAGVLYWLVFLSDTDGLASVRTASGAGGYQLYKSQTYGDFPTTFGTAYGPIGVTHHMRMTYTSTGGLQGAAYAIKVVLSGDTADVTSMNLYSSVAGPLRVAIYSDSSGTPDTLLWESAEVTAAANNWTTVMVPSGSMTALNPGTYWLAFQWNSASAGPNYVTGAAGSGNKVSLSYGAFPATWGSGTSTIDHWSIFLTYDVHSTNSTSTPTDTSTAPPIDTSSPSLFGMNLLPIVIVVIVVIVVVVVALMFLSRRKKIADTLSSD